MIKQIILAGVAVLVLTALADARTVRGLPDAMLGDWCPANTETTRQEAIFARGHCPDSDGRLTTRRNEIKGYEDNCTFHRAKRLARNSYIIHTHCAGEALLWTKTVILKLIGDKLHMSVVYHSREKPEPQETDKEEEHLL
jgi:hypothetical protein